MLERRDDKPIATLRTTIANQRGETVIDGTALVYRDPSVGLASIRPVPSPSPGPQPPLDPPPATGRIAGR